MSTSISADLPPLDCHAHIAPDVTDEQLAKLGDVTVFAVTRSLEESQTVATRADQKVVWGCGVHPGLLSARSAFEEGKFRELLASFALVGEVGLDRRAGGLPEQFRILRAVFAAISDEPVLVSVHSTGCTTEVVELIREIPHPGVILHSFLGRAEDVRRAASAGCYFSVNASMSDVVLRRIPLDRMLPETDFPSLARAGGGTWPADIGPLEGRLADLTGQPVELLRRSWYLNLRTVALASGALERLPALLADRLLMT